ncbi:hypothetical protein QYM36_003278 [Artemia franciscana]|uniref:Protein aurora borealis n=1 Tax=Artemia franciscana TaxID=6661 RepID=A0AA88LE05_ARTSF|nr:hypothetical protein QYM36_003278 [Artemia franciscana]
MDTTSAGILSKENKIEDALPSEKNESVGSTFLANLLLKDHQNSTSQEFRWSIDHVAIMKPVNITHSPLARQYRQRVDPLYESRVQDAIDTFFSQAEIVPSPARDIIPKAPLRPSRSSSLCDSTRYNVATQTILSLPSVLPKHVEDIFKEYMNECSVERDAFVCEDLETSSFRRRKLFGDSDCELDSESSYRGTPEFQGRVDLNESTCPDAPNRGSLLGTPGSIGISSSPITPPDERMASLMDGDSSSPPISPIAHLKSRILCENSKTARRIDLDQEDISVISFTDGFSRRNDLMSSTAFPVTRDFEFTKIQPITELDESVESEKEDIQPKIQTNHVVLDTGYSTFFHGDMSSTNTDVSHMCSTLATGVKRPLPVSPAINRESKAQVGTPIGCSTPTK